jgi:hypothetical protein
MRETAMSGWEVLALPYFTKICRATVGPPLSAAGFVETRVEPGGSLVFSRGDSFIILGYFADYAPLELLITIGTGGSQLDSVGRFNFVPLWFALRELSIEADKSIWHFERDAKSLERQLGKVRDNLIVPIALPLMDDTERLTRLIERYRVEYRP